MQNTGQGNLLRVFLALSVKIFNVKIIFLNNFAKKVDK